MLGPLLLQLEAGADARHTIVDKHVEARHKQQKLKDQDTAYIIVSNALLSSHALVWLLLCTTCGVLCAC